MLRGARRDETSISDTWVVPFMLGTLQDTE